MFSLDTPSQINYQTPDWLGGFKDWVGSSERAVGAASEALYNNVRAFTNPVAKVQTETSQAALNVIKGGVDEAYGAIGGATSAIAAGLRKTVEPISSGIKWGLIIVIVGVALYAYAVARPFLPAPGGRS